MNSVQTDETPTVQSVERALRLLQALARHGSWVGVREVAREVELSPATALNLLRTCQAAGFVEQDEATRRYRLGLAAMRLTGAADPVPRLAEFARPHLDRLYDTMLETVAALTLVAGQPVVVHWRQSEQPLAATHPRGPIEDTYLLASGRVLLAWQEADWLARYAARQSYPPGQGAPRTAAELLGLLASVKAQGWAETSDVLGSGIAAMGAPVFDAAGRLVLALGCSLPVQRVDDAQRRRMRESTLATAAAMTRELGGQA